MTIGFVTIAIGNNYYFQMAANLLKSYRIHYKEPLQFAILTDKANDVSGILKGILLESK